jgi:putative addiction module killer protein
MKCRVFRTEEFSDWLETQPPKSKTQIEKRIMRIQQDGYFGTINDVEDGVFELKWKDVRRVYYVYLLDEEILLLLGGNKNGQSYDINQAKRILKEYTQDGS